MTTLITILFALAAAAVQTAAPDAQKPAPPRSDAAVEAQLWFVQFDASLTGEELPFDLRAAARELEKMYSEHGLPARVDDRIQTTGLALHEKIDEFETRARGHVLRFRGRQLVTDKSDDAAGPAPWRILAGPRLLLLLGQDASAEVGRSVPYLVPEPDKRLRVEWLEGAEREGATVTIRADHIRDDGVRFEKIELQMKTIARREPIQGLDLDVGKPIMETRQTQLSNTLAADKVAIIPLPQREDEPPILVFMTARPQAAPPKAEERGNP